jgi:predicted AlkP superfamily pyrophosphatase or phosphodiesterase
LFLSAALGALIPNLPFIIIDFPAWLMDLLSRQTVYVEDSIWMVIRYYHLIDQDWLVNAVVWSLIILAILHITFSANSLVVKTWVIIAVTILLFPSYPPQYNLWLLPLFVLCSTFALIPFLVFDFLNSTVILAWFAVDNPFQPWGVIWDISLFRIGILILLLIWVTRRRIASIHL